MKNGIYIGCYIPAKTKLESMFPQSFLESKVPEKNLEAVLRDLELGYVKHSILKTRLTVN